ncbi:MAG TPA: DUF6600 domain-containing protein [Steroidobacteraceae bacterium]|nr:DUF6600 domain-containing protein [Steroidobacteraceae bacterium]
MTRLPLARLMLGLLAWGTAVLAQQPEPDAPAVAARLSYAQGAVSMQPAGTTDWVGVEVNRPLTGGDKLWSDQGARAELQLGPVSIRTDESTAIAILDLDATTLQLQLSGGTLELHVPVYDPSETIEVDTPTLAVNVQQAGDYRIEADPSGGVAAVKVSGGSAQVSGAGDTFQVAAPRQALFTDTGGLTEDLGPLGAPDAFDAWCQQRDQQQQQALQAESPYVSPDMTGYEDLSAYGSWQSLPDYGAVWTPDAAPVGWVPYTYGTWVWIAPWGWTWIDRQPWGFAPFHYGRWVYLSGTWGWVPGPRRAHPVYSPALVGWVSGARVGGVPGIGWFALGPRDAYVPGGNVQLHSVNAAVPGAILAVAQQTFVGAQPVAAHSVRLAANASTLASAAPPRLLPTRASVLGVAPGTRAASAPPPAWQGQRVVVRRIPPPSPPAFQQQLQLAQLNGGRPPTRQQIRQLASAQPAMTSALATPPTRAPSGPNSVWQPAATAAPLRAPRNDRPAPAQGTVSFYHAPPVAAAAPAPGEPSYGSPAVSGRYAAPPAAAATQPAPSNRSAHVHEQKHRDARASAHPASEHPAPK